MRKLTPAHAYIVLHERVVLCACGSTGPWLAAREYECREARSFFNYAIYVLEAN